MQVLPAEDGLHRSFNQGGERLARIAEHGGCGRQAAIGLLGGGDAVDECVQRFEFGQIMIDECGGEARYRLQDPVDERCGLPDRLVHDHA